MESGVREGRRNSDDTLVCFEGELRKERTVFEVHAKVQLARPVEQITQRRIFFPIVCNVYRAQHLAGVEGFFYRMNPVDHIVEV